MAEILRKGDIMILYKCRYGERALAQSVQLGYTIKDYAEAIRVYDKMEKGISQTEFEKIYGKRTYTEKVELDKFNNFI